jgi:hypothetical protein
MAPYKAVVAFDWGAPPEEPLAVDTAADGGGISAASDGSASGSESHGTAGASLPRAEIEGELLRGLGEYQVFSDLVVSDLGDVYAACESEEADLMVILRIDDLVRWDEKTTRTVTDMAILGSVIWIATGIGSWWIPEVAFPTSSRMEVAWKRMAGGRGDASSPRPQTPEDIRADFRLRERLSTGEYRLSFWERAKPWGAPLAYLTSIVIPPAFVPLRDSEEVAHSLGHAALYDVRRELAQKLRGGYLGAAGSPLLFRLEEPRNGGSVQGDRARLRFQYRVEPGFEEHEATGLSALSVLIKRKGEAEYQLWHAYDDAEVRALNGRITRSLFCEEEVGGLGPGLNRIRFVARTELGKQWITNTVAIRRD